MYCISESKKIYPKAAIKYKSVP